MQEIITVNARGTIATAGGINSAMLNQFVSFIDRSETTTRTYIINLRQFFAWLRYSCIDRPQRDDILFYREWLQQEHEAIELDPDSPDGWKYRTDRSGNRRAITCKPNTTAQYLRSVCQFFAWTEASELYPNIAKNIHAPKLNHEHHKKDALTVSEVQAIESSIAATAAAKAAQAATADKDIAGRIQRTTEQGKRLYAMYLLAVNAGLRTIEISRANVKDLETKNGCACLYIWGKGHSEADTKKAIAPEVKAAIDDYLQSRTDKPTGNSPLFVSTGNRSRGKRIAATTISTMLKGAMKGAGFDSERLTAHSLRHTAGNTVRQITGNNIYETQKYMRHSNPATTEIYMHDGQEETQQQADLAQRLYNRYHNIEADDGNKATLYSIIDTLTPAQLAQLTTIAEAMRRA